MRVDIRNLDLTTGPTESCSCVRWDATLPRLPTCCSARAPVCTVPCEPKRQRTRDKAAGISTAAVQDQLHSLLWEDLITYLQEERLGQPVIEELERLRVA
jgi:hypothetical protein